MHGHNVVAVQDVDMHNMHAIRCNLNVRMNKTATLLKKDCGLTETIHSCLNP
jgi:hypothetical protein